MIGSCETGLKRQRGYQSEEAGSDGCTYSNIHSRRKYCPLVRREGCEGNAREAVADGGGSRRAEFLSSRNHVPVLSRPVPPTKTAA